MSDPAPRILIADDQGDILQALRLLLKGAGFQVETATSPAGVVSRVESEDFDVVLVDLNYTRDTTSGAEGLELIARIRQVDAAPPVVVMTAWGSVEGAVEAMRRGAHDYVEKPWDNERLLETLRTQVELGRALRTARAPAPGAGPAGGLPHMVAESLPMRRMMALLARVGPSEASVLITGEHGTGKEVVAQWLHASSPRASRPLVTVNAGGISGGVFESELFGHVKGAFTDARNDRVGYFELADGGTLFLDEIGNLSVELQSRLLRVLQTGEFQRVGSSRTLRADVRVLSATNADVRREVAEGRFREDLLYRLNTVEVQIPPLRERRVDIPLLAAYFLREQAQRSRLPLDGFTSEAMQALLAHSWPGNVRELRHTIERAALLAEGPRVGAADLRLRPSASASSAEGAPLEDMELGDVERVLIQKALKRFDGNVSQAADALGLSRSALYRRLQRHGL